MSSKYVSEQTGFEKVTAMRAGGRRLAQVRQQLVEFSQPGVTFEAIEAEAQRLIKAAGAQPNFAMVPGYHWATCIMKNDAVCHGIPQGQQLEPGDLITIDVGLLYQGFHLDTSVSFGVPPISTQVSSFLEVGRRSLTKAIARVKPGASVYDVSHAMQKVVESAGCGAVYQLTGHGIGRSLHEDPAIPCVVQRRDKRLVLKPGQTIAVEIMYTQGAPDLVVDADGWTYRTKDHSLSAMFEETVLVTEQGNEILTTI